MSISLLGCGGGEATDPDDSSIRPASYRLVWADEFENAGSLDPNYWAYDLGAPLLGGTVWGNSEQQYYTSDAINVRIENGNLLIQPVAGIPQGAPVTDPPLLATSARVKTDKQAFYTALSNKPYGFYEIKADIPCVAGAWPAIWMMGKDGVWPNRGELDIMEWFGRYFVTQPDQIQSGVHTADNFGANSLYDKINLTGVCQGFHRFQLHWQVNRLAFYVDDQFVFQYNKPLNASLANWPFDQSSHLLLNVAVGGNLGGNVNLNSIKDMGMKVDYVRVWQP
jgi:hypothetical protein